MDTDPISMITDFRRHNWTSIYIRQNMTAKVDPLTERWAIIYNGHRPNIGIQMKPMENS